MNQVDALNEDIFKLTLKIQEWYPELYEFLAEMPDTIPNIKYPAINFETLTSYYNSLKSLVDTYNNKNPGLRLRRI